MTRSARSVDDDRLAQGDAAVYSVADAARLLPWRDSDARAWLEKEGLIIRRPGLPGPVVRWRDVVAALLEEVVEEPVRLPTGGSLPRKPLKR